MGWSQAQSRQGGSQLRPPLPARSCSEAPQLCGWPLSSDLQPPELSQPCILPPHTLLQSLPPAPCSPSPGPEGTQSPGVGELTLTPCALADPLSAPAAMNPLSPSGLPLPSTSDRPASPLTAPNTRFKQTRELTRHCPYFAVQVWGFPLPSVHRLPWSGACLPSTLWGQAPGLIPFLRAGHVADAVLTFLCLSSCEGRAAHGQRKPQGSRSLEV